MTGPGAIGDGNDLCTLYIVPPSPLSQIFTLTRYVPPQNLRAAFKSRLGIFGNPLRGLDVHQIEASFLYVLQWWRGGVVFKRQSSSLSQSPLSLRVDTPIH